MKDLDRDKVDLANGGVTSTYMKLLLPTLTGMLFTSLFLLADGIFVGKGIGSDALAAINIVMPIFNVATGFGMMLATGVSVIAAIHMAQDNLKAARIVVTQAFGAVIFLGLLVGVLMYVFPSGMLNLLGASDSLMGLCKDYYLWFLPCALFVAVQMVGQFVIRLDGDPKFASMLEIVPALLNIFLDWLLIFPMGMGVAGAGLATSIGSFVGVSMAFYYMLRRSRQLSFYRLKMTVTSLVLTLRNIAAMAKAGLSGFLGEFSISVLTLVGNYVFMKYLGDDGVAAFSVTCYLAPVVFMIYAAISQSAQPMLSYSFGAGDFARVGKVLRLISALSVAAGVIMALGLSVFCEPVLSIFLDRGSSAFDMCAYGFPLFTVGFAFMAVNITFIGYAQSVKKSILSAVLTTLRGMILPSLTFIVLPMILGVNGLWLAVPAAELFISLAIVALWGLGIFRLR